MFGHMCREFWTLLVMLTNDQTHDCMPHTYMYSVMAVHKGDKAAFSVFCVHGSLASVCDLSH